jgi:cytochrome b561
MAAPAGYSRLQIALHWIAAVLIVLQFVLHDSISAAWDAIGKGIETAFDPLVMAHVVGGMLVLLLAFWRLSIKARRGAPAIPGDSAVQRAVARLTHVGLMALMVLMPVSGAAAWFGGVEAAAEGHEALKVVLMALVALHVAGALYHQFVLKDGVLDRMRRARG